MRHKEDIVVDLSGYEKSLVKQFETMELIVGISKEERELILKGSVDSLMKNTEDKEAILDRFSLLEENSRMFLQNLFLKLKIQSENTSVRDILPYLEAEDSSRINHLLDGINILVQEARTLNLGNQALVLTRMDWLKATQSFIAALSQPEECYQVPVMESVGCKSSVSSLEYSA